MKFKYLKNEKFMREKNKEKWKQIFFTCLRKEKFYCLRVFLAIFLPPSFVTIHTANGFLCIKFPFRKLERKEGDEEKLKVLRRKIFSLHFYLFKFG